MSNYSVRSLSITAGKFLKLIGFGTFSLVDEKVKVTAFDFACFTFNISVGCLVFYLSLWYSGQQLNKSSVLLSIGIFITMNGGSLITIVSMASVFWHRNRIWKLLTMLDKVVEKFRTIKVFSDFTHYMIAFAVVATVSFAFIAIGLLAMFFFLEYRKKLGVLLIYGYLSATFATSMLWTAMFHLAIYIRLRLLNDTIRWESSINSGTVIEKIRLTNQKIFLFLENRFWMHDQTASKWFCLLKMTETRWF